MQMIKKLLPLGLILLIIGIAVGIYLKNKKVAGLEDTQPDFTVNATNLYEEFTKDENAATAKYNNKIVAVTGDIQDVKPVNDSTTTVLLVAESSGLGTVKCTFIKEQAKQAAALQVKNKITVKGAYSGISKVEDFGIILIDIELSRCVLVK
jgi:RecG-like helicase